MLYNLITAAYMPYTGLNHNIWGRGGGYLAMVCALWDFGSSFPYYEIFYPF